ncbi:MAG: iron response transcriptional regulator IrrA [Rhodospirillaceae bacterium]
MPVSRPYKRAFELLTQAGLRPTRQRVGLSRLLFESGHRHVTAEQLHAEAMAGGLRVSLATVYNALHQMTDAGMLREVLVEAGRSYFDTNTSVHHHFFHEESGWLLDVPGSARLLEALPLPPSGTRVKQVDVVIRLVGKPD